MSVVRRHWNAWLWGGFAVVLASFVSYIPVFALFPATRDVPWVNFLLFGTSGAFLFFGLKRAFGQPKQLEVFGNIHAANVYVGGSMTWIRNVAVSL